MSCSISDVMPPLFVGDEASEEEEEEEEEEVEEVEEEEDEAISLVKESLLCSVVCL